MEEKQFQKARAIIEKLIEVQKTKDIGKYFLAYYFLEVDQTEKAKEIIKQMNIYMYLELQKKYYIHPRKVCIVDFRYG